MDQIDLALFRPWPAEVSAQDLEPDDGRLGRVAARIVLELKSAEAPPPVEDYRLLLNDLTTEMRDQFALFRALRTSAERLITDGDEAAGKLARADAKAATDAMSLIVRTLEKVDSLQRQLARDRAEAEQRAAESEDHDAVREKLRRTIEARAQEQARILFEAWKDRGAGPDTAGRDEGEPGDAPGAGGP